MTRILGIDPGSQRTGVGIIDVDATGKVSHVHHQPLVLLDAETFPLRLRLLLDGLWALIEEYTPHECTQTGAGARCGGGRLRGA